MSIAEAARYSAPVLDCAIGRLSMSRWMASICSGSRPKAPRQRIVDMRLDGAGAIEGLAQADHAGIGVDADPDDVGELAVRKVSIETIFMAGPEPLLALRFRRRRRAN